jgi:hypothetical protein
LDKIDPPVTDPEATLIEKTPQLTGHELPPPMTSPDSRSAQKEEREIPLPLAIGCIALVILAAICVIGAYLIYNNLQEQIINNPDTFFEIDPEIASGSIEGAGRIGYGGSVNGRLHEGNNFEESWIFEAAGR